MKKSPIFRIVLIVVLLGAWYWKRTQTTPESDSGETATAVLKENPLGEGSANPETPTAVLKENPIGEEPASSSSSENAKHSKVRGYDKIEGARLVEDKGNDGDSFVVNLGNREIELRLYFVDAPEKYISDRFENQQRRVAEQAREMGGVSPEQIVEVGKAAKLYMERELGKKPFTVYTYWEQVFEGERYYGFVELEDGSYFGTRLVENGLARIHTKGPGSKEKPVPTPRGDSFHQHRDRLFSLERKAQKADRGAWGL